MTSERSATEWPLSAVGRRLTDAYKAKGWSRTTAAERSGISYSTWRNVGAGFTVEQGQRRPTRTSPDTLARMARTVGLDPRELVTDAGMDPHDISPALLSTTLAGDAELLVITDGWDELGPDERQVAAAMIQKMVEISRERKKDQQK